MGKTLKTFKVFKIFKTFRYSKNISIIVNVFKKQKDSLTIVGWLAITYVLISALIIFNVEPDTFDTFFDKKDNHRWVESRDFSYMATSTGNHIFRFSLRSSMLTERI